MNYNEWLSMSDEQREETHFRTWNVYERDGFPIAHMAASRLAMITKFKIYDIRIGTYHGGEYTLEPYVSNFDYSKCPPMLEQSFEGFRVIWHPLSHVIPNSEL